MATKLKAGQQVGRWLLIEHQRHTSSNGKKYGMWLCDCTCGETKGRLVSPYTLNAGKSTGCRKCSTVCQGNSKGISWKGYGEIPMDYWNTLRKARERQGKYGWDLTIEQGWNLYQRQQGRCALTGIKLQFRNGSKQEGTASLDRIDSQRGYELGNVQWVLKDINLMKGCLDEARFIELCKAVVGNAI